VIDAKTGWDAELVFGLTGVASSSMVQASAGVDDTWTYIWFTSATSGAYRHEFTVDLSNTERPTLSLQEDGKPDVFTWCGCVVDQFKVTAALKAIVEGSATILGFSEVTGDTESALTLEDFEPMIFQMGDFSLGPREYDYCRNFDLTTVNNHNADGYGAGSQNLDRQYQQKGKFGASGTMQVRLDTNSYAERVKVFNNTRVAISALFRGGYIYETGSIREFMLIEMPYANLTTFDWSENNGIFDASVGYIAVKPKGTVYNSPFKITLINTDASAY